MLEIKKIESFLKSTTRDGVSERKIKADLNTALGIQCQLSIVEYIEYFGPHIGSLPRVLAKATSNEAIEEYHTHLVSIEILFKQHPCAHFSNYQKKLKTGEYQPSNLVFFLLHLFKKKLVNSLDECLENLITVDNNLLGKHVHQIIHHPFLRCQHLHRGSNPGFTNEMYYQLYWGLALIHTMYQKAVPPKEVILYSTFLGMLAKATSNTQGSSDQAVMPLSSEFKSTAETDALNAIYNHNHRTSTDTTLDRDIFIQANELRKHCQLTYFDQTSIEIVLNKLIPEDASSLKLASDGFYGGQKKARTLSEETIPPYQGIQRRSALSVAIAMSKML